MLMEKIKQIGVVTDRDNANVGNNFSAKLLRIASEANKEYVLNYVLRPDLKELHENGDLYYHDLDSYNLTINCLHVPTGEVLAKGFNTGYGTIRPPKDIGVACELSCILLQSTQNDMFGGQAHPDFDNDMAPYVQKTRELYGEENLEKHIRQAMQGVVYNLNTMHARAGSQVPFSSVNLGIPKSEDSALVCKIFLEEYNKGLGKGEQPIFPNIIFRVKEGVNRNPEDPYYYLYELACEVASKRMNPTFMNMDSSCHSTWYYKGYMPATMGCRTAIMDNINGEPGTKGRGNIAPVTINLPRLAIESDKDIDLFFKRLESMLISALDSLIHRFFVLRKLKVSDLPFVAGEGLLKGSEGLTRDDSIEPILRQGTWGIGFIGLAEALVALTGEHHGESQTAQRLGIHIIRYIRDFCDTNKKMFKLNFSCYATPAEGLSGKFIEKDKKKYGIIKGVTDKDYYTNSFHIPVTHKTSFVHKINTEAPYHALCNGGHISYIEVDGNPTGKDIMEIVNYSFVNTDMSYLGINFHIRYCKNCGERVKEEAKKCTCGSVDIQGISRVTGYLSLDERFCPSKAKEREDRSKSISYMGS